MLTGRFGNTSRAPYIEATLSFPRLRVRSLVSFLVDTGAAGSIIMPADSKNLGVDFAALTTPTISIGIGGEARGFSEWGVWSFSDRRHIFSYSIELEIPTPTNVNLWLPSLLGRDVLNRWRVVSDFTRNEVRCTPRTWDARRKIL